MYNRVSALEAVAQTLSRSRPVVSVTYRNNPALLSTSLLPFIPSLFLSTNSFSSSNGFPNSYSNISSSPCSCGSHHCSSKHSLVPSFPRRFSSGSSSGSTLASPSTAAATSTDTNSTSSIPESSSAPFSSSSPASVSVPGVTTGGDLMIMLYTCRVCETRSARQISKLGYYQGSVIVRCPGCKNLHLISDHLGWFDDDKTLNAETLIQRRGEAVRNGLIQEGKDTHVIELTEADRKVLLSRTKSVRLTDNQELEVVPVGNDHSKKVLSVPSEKIK